MSQKTNVALAQLRPALQGRAKNLRTIARVLAEHDDADLVVFPELFLSGYTVRNPEELAVDIDGPEAKSIADAARKHCTAVVFGAPERIAAGVANSAICVHASGKVLGSYRKTHLFGAERTAFAAGDDLLVVDVAGLKVGLMICFDVEFPEVARALAKAGADVLVTVSANMDPFGRDHDVFAVARALENGLPHLYVNQVGVGEEFTFVGGTMAVSADGDRLAEAGAEERVIRLAFNPFVRSDERPETLRPNYLEQARGRLPVDTRGEPKQW